MLRHIPNVLTILRMLLTVPLAWMLRNGRYDAALLLALVAGASDALDGYLAKRFNWQSWLGGVLDPIADKLMLMICYICLAMAGALPPWLAWLVVGRDLVIVAGAVAYHNLVGPLTASPTTISKATTCLQIGLVLATLLHLSRFAEWPDWINATLFAIVAVATVASGLDYVLRWSIKAWRETHTKNGAASP
ncbi:CDP-alcohol phosphatidyltransferase family protein [Tahibacter amnicola]|uniref:CDP-diacylglycerol--glycerol-3-phosphate 3-phosphatidyltransferase n=1 Tax=Tahibacter amnicola TaxID=2976241 RepID=A0ABY6BHD8_9GAMM|nr:CDP-alcohol phosphatidyltransferase family protein [Tahibacter amnicola]UXI69438.1 CDP-alcohol phosphatidyltransferase family protein [Tahibacter amnicola]